MSALLRTLARLVTFALLVALSLCGLAIAVFAIGGSTSGDFSLPGLAKLVHLPQLRSDIGELYARLEAPGSVAAISATSILPIRPPHPTTPILVPAIFLTPVY